jgi:glycerol kinase
MIERSGDVQALAESVPDTGGVVMVPAFVGLGAPHWDSGARGLVIGITRGTTAAHIARATLESIALQVGDVVRAMIEDSGIELGEIRIDGGAAANDLLAQLQADVLDVDVVRPADLETTSLGVAYLAGLATGVWPDETAVASIWREDQRFRPAMRTADREAMIARWREAVERSRGWTQFSEGRPGDSSS